jgi:transcriptional regulator with AAA-type ATPase domain
LATEGTFTGARKKVVAGKIEAADGGTLFLDEIGEIPLDIQPYLLRVLEENAIYRLGENTPVNFRLVAASHRDLKDAIAKGTFRTDLFYRIAVTTVSIPSLQEQSRGELLVPREGFTAFGQPVTQTGAGNFALRIAAKHRLMHDHQARAGGPNLVFERKDGLDAL